MDLHKPAPPTLPQSLGKSNGRGGSKSASEPERDMQLAFEEQEKLLLAAAASSLRPRRPSTEPPHPQTEEPRGAKRRQPDETEIGSDIHYAEAGDCSHDTGDEVDEDPRPAKRRRHPPTDNAPALPDGPAPVAGDDHPSRTSQSPSVTVESAPFAEYQEWPFRGYLKRTKIGNKTIYSLEFQLPHVPEHEHLRSEALGMRCDKETSAEAGTPHDASPPSKIHPAAVRPRIKRVPWTLEEDATVLKKRRRGRPRKQT
jgi:hypothetical protein